MQKLAVFLLLTFVSSCVGQVPDTPQPQPKHAFNKYSGHYILGWKEAATGKQFWIPYGAFWAASIADVEITHEGVAHHHCTEQNPIFSPHPGRGELYREVLAENAAITALGYAMRKLGFRWWVYDPVAAYGTAIHVQGAASWLGRCW
jgi:hypothetical protein